MKFPCRLCGSSFASQYGLNRHTDSIHAKHQVECPKCGKELSRADKLKRHMLNVHGISIRAPAKLPTSRMAAECPKCGKVLSRGDGMKRHMLKVHGTSIRASAQLPTSPRMESDDKIAPAKKSSKGNSKSNNRFDQDIKNEDSEYITRDLIPVHDENSHIEKTVDHKSFNFNSAMKLEVLGKETIFGNDSRHYEHIKSELICTLDTEERLEHLSSVNTRCNEDNSLESASETPIDSRHLDDSSNNSNSFSISLGQSPEPPIDSSQGGDSFSTVSENPSNVQYKSNINCSATQSQQLNRTDTVGSMCSKCQKAECECHITITSHTNADCNYKSKRNRTKIVITCEKCGKTFRSPSVFKVHKDTNCETLKPYICQICVIAFNRPVTLKHHNYVHHIKEPGNHQCKVCKRQFPNNFLLVKHNHKCKADILFSEIRERITCDSCQKSFRSKKAFKRHFFTTHMIITQFICTHCKKQFYSKEILVYHLKSNHHSEMYSCEFCHASFKLKGNLMSHIKKHSAAEWICEICGKDFHGKKSLVRHMFTHSDEKPYVCEVCGKGFRSTTNLQQHSVTHSDVRPFACDLCGTAFRIRNHLKQHMAVHGMVNSSTKRKRNFE